MLALDHPLAIVCAGTSDLPVLTETQRSARYLGIDSEIFADVGVAGLWRQQEVLPDLRRYALVIAVAGMEADAVPPRLLLPVTALLGLGVEPNRLQPPFQWRVLAGIGPKPLPPCLQWRKRIKNHFKILPHARPTFINDPAQPRRNA